MKRNKIAAVLLGMGLMAGMLALPVTVPTRPAYAAVATEQVIGHGEWKQEDGKWYYYQDGEMLKNCWLKDGIDWYYLNEDGSMKADEWFTDTDGNIYYFRTWGGMHLMHGEASTESVTISAAGARRGITAGIRLVDSGITSTRMERQ